MKFQNHQDLKPPKTLQKAEKIDFCKAKVYEGVISYHIVAVLLRGALLLRFWMTLSAPNYIALQYLGQTSYKFSI